MELKKNKALDYKYSGIQAFYFMALAAIMGYASVYLLAKGYSNSEIGVTMAVSSIISVFVQPLAASYVDRHKNIALNKVVAVALSFIALMGFLLYFITSQSILIVILFVSIGVTVMSLQPVMNALAFSFEKHGIQLNFGLARGIGSVAYAVCSYILGKIVESQNPDIIPLFFAFCALGVVMIVLQFKLPKENEVYIDEVKTTSVHEISLLDFSKKYKRFMLFVVGSIAIFFGHSFVNSFFIQVISNVGGTSSDMGTAIFLAAVLELPTMAYFSKIQGRFGCAKLLKIAGVFFAIKQIITFLAPSVMMIYFAQFFQIFAYALFIPASVYYVNEIISKEDNVKGQAMATLAVSASGVFASLLGGVLLDSIGVNSVLLLTAIVSVIGALIIFISVEQR